MALRYPGLLAGGALLLASSAAQAIIIGGAVTNVAGQVANDAFDQGGTFVELTLPFMPPNGAQNAVGNDTFQTPNLYAFNEAQNVTLTGDFAVNLGSPLTAGMVIASHYVFFDPLGGTFQQGYVDFDAAILAVITSTALLDASDAFLNNNVTYLNPSARGLEAGDVVTIGGVGEAHRLYVDWFAITPGDYVRVITAESPGGNDPCATNPPGVGGCPAPVPAPAPFGALLVGLAGIARALRHRTVHRGR